MDDLISRQAILKHIEMIRQGALMMDDIRRASIIMNGMYLCEEAVINQPSADAVKVVRCKDCVNCEYDSIFNQYWCGGSEVISDGFCNYGEREDPLHGAMNPPEDDITDGKGVTK